MKCLIHGLVPKLYWRWHYRKKPRINLEGLPLDILIMVILSLDGVSDLSSLIRTSTTFKRIFDRYRKSILLGVCRNMVGSTEATWRAVTTVLVYQRPINTNPGHYLPDFLTVRFELEESDIHQLIDNLLLFTNTSKKFSSYLDSPGDHEIPADCSFKPGDSLPKKVFFDNWLLEFQVRYDPIMTFANRTPYTKAQLADAALVKGSIFPGDYSYFPRSGPLWERGGFHLDVAAYNRIVAHTSSCLQCLGYNKLLWLKILYHYDFVIWKDSEDTMTISEYNSLVQQLCNDMALKGVEYLVEKYELSCGWDSEG